MKVKHQKEAEESERKQQVCASPSQHN